MKTIKSSAFVGPAVNRAKKSDQLSPLALGEVRRPSPEQLARLAEKIHGLRARRRLFFGSDHLAEPAWEMLIALYRADAAFHRMTVTHLCDASHSPATTALRWIEKLFEIGLIRRQKNPLDARVIFIELEPKARAAMQTYLSVMWATLYSD